jgi:hypothetical protein
MRFSTERKFQTKSVVAISKRLVYDKCFATTYPWNSASHVQSTLPLVQQ